MCHVVFIFSIISVCDGSVILLHNKHPLNITADEIRRQSLENINFFSRVTSGLKNPDNGKILKYVFIETLGNCCWEFRSREKGGQSFRSLKPERNTGNWPIKNVTLVECSIIVESGNEDTKCEAENDGCEFSTSEYGTKENITPTLAIPLPTNGSKKAEVDAYGSHENSYICDFTCIAVSTICGILVLLLILIVSMMCWFN